MLAAREQHPWTFRAHSSPKTQKGHGTFTFRSKSDRVSTSVGRAPADWPIAGARAAPITTGAYQADTGLPNFSETDTVTTGLARERPIQAKRQPAIEAEIKIEEERPSSEK